MTNFPTPHSPKTIIPSTHGNTRDRPASPHRFLAAFLGLFLCLLALPTPTEASSSSLNIGTNLSGPVDYGSEWPFVNIMKFSRAWITHNSVWVPGGVNPWDSGVLDQVPQDAQGYPLSLPLTIAGTEATQIVRTVWANTAELPAGTYTILYEGQGVLDVWGDAAILTQTPGRLEFELTPGVGGLFALELRESQAGDHVRNIRVLLPGTEGTYLTNPWSQEWIDKLAPFETLRFMDWGSTNNSRLVQWSDRTRVDDYTYTLDGIPYEWMIEICNLKQADVWVCTPHEADDNYIRNLAQLFRDNLDPNLTIYVEYSNEIWNWIFSQTHYCFDNGDPAVEWPERIVPFIQNTLDLWTEEFAGQTDRLVRTVGVQASWQDVSNRIVFNMTPGSFDAFSPAAYFGFSGAGYAALEALGAGATGEDALFWAREGMLNGSYLGLQSQKASIADPLGIPMIYYEGGQHLTPSPFGTVQPYNPALVDVQTLPGMYDLYVEWMDSLSTFVPDGETTLFANFAFISPQSGQFGSWGVLESQFNQFPPYDGTAPKFQALLDALCDPSTVPSLPVGELDASPHHLTFANPILGRTQLGFFVPEEADVLLRVFDAQGRQLETLTDRRLSAGHQTVSWDPADLPAGLYFLRLESGGLVSEAKALRVR